MYDGCPIACSPPTPATSLPGAAALITNDPAIAIRAALGGFGWGDGRYVPITGAATAAVSLTVEWWALLIACAAAIIATPLRRRRANFPFAPWLAAGALVALFLLG